MTQLFVGGNVTTVAEAIEEARRLPATNAMIRLGDIAVAAKGALPSWSGEFSATELETLACHACSSIRDFTGGQEYLERQIRPRLVRFLGSNLLNICKANIAGQLNTPWWHDNAYGLADAINLGAAGNTTNPLLVWAAIQANPEKWAPILDAMWKMFPTYTPEQIGLEMTVLVIAEHAALLKPIYAQTGGSLGVVSLQLAPNCAHDSEAMLQQAITIRGRLDEMGIYNVVFKVPGTHAGYEVVGEIMTTTNTGVNITVNYTLAQQIAFAEAIELADISKPSYLTQMNGRLAAPISVDLPSVDPILVQKWAMHAVRQSAYLTLYLQRGYEASRPLGAAIRGPWDLDGALYNGPIPFCVTMFPNMQDLYDNERRQIDPNGLWAPIPKGILATLLGSSVFRQAYLPDGLKPSQFDNFPATVATLLQFCAEYDAFVAWCAANKPA